MMMLKLSFQRMCADIEECSRRIQQGSWQLDNDKEDLMCKKGTLTTLDDNEHEKTGKERHTCAPKVFKV